MVAQGRVELPAVGYEPTMLPLHYRASILVRTKGIEPLTLVWKTSTLPLRQARFKIPYDSHYLYDRYYVVGCTLFVCAMQLAPQVIWSLRRESWWVWMDSNQLTLTRPDLQSEAPLQLCRTPL